MSNRFFFDGPLRVGELVLDGPEAHHLASVRRFTVGDAITLFNGDGLEYPAVIQLVAKKRVTVHVQVGLAISRELGFTLHIASALPKGDRGDFLIEKLTELGVTDFTPLGTERSIVKAGDAKIEKLQRAAIEASKQCGRNMLMRIHEPANWLRWCTTQSGRRLLAHFANRVPAYSPAPENVLVGIGPEGGFTEGEVRAATECGWQVISLGPRTLRVETAAIAIAAYLGMAGRA